MCRVLSNSIVSANIRERAITRKAMTLRRFLFVFFLLTINLQLYDCFYWKKNKRLIGWSLALARRGRFCFCFCFVCDFFIQGSGHFIRKLGKFLGVCSDPRIDRIDEFLSGTCGYFNFFANWNNRTWLWCQKARFFFRTNNTKYTSN